MKKTAVIAFNQLTFLFKSVISQVGDKVDRKGFMKELDVLCIEWRNSLKS